MINFNSSEIYTRQTLGNNPAVSSSRSTPVENSPATYRNAVDTVSISAAAKSGAASYSNETQQTYEHLGTPGLYGRSSTGPAKYESISGRDDGQSFTAKAMASVVENRLGIDRKKLDEIDAMIEDVAKNENLSPEQKAKQIEELQEQREMIVEEETRKIQNRPSELGR